MNSGVEEQDKVLLTFVSLFLRVLYGLLCSILACESAAQAKSKEETL